MNERDFIKTYRRQVEERMEVPPGQCWDEISTKLDLEEAWDGISAELDRVMPVRDKRKDKIIFFTRAAAIAASVALLAMLAVPGLRNSDDDTTENNSPGGEIIAGQPSLNDTPSEIKIPDPRPITDDNILNRAGVTGPLTDMSDLPEHKQSPDDVIFNKESNNRLAGAVTFAYLEPLRNKPVSTKGHDNLSDALKKTAFLSDEAAVQKQNDIPVSRGSIYAGLSVSGKNTWLLSEETFSGLNKHNLNTTKFNFLNDLGVTVIYSPNLKWSFEGNGFVSSKNGQSYRQYINGIYSDKSYVLRYSSVELTAQRNISKRTVKSKPVVMINAGLYLSYLHSAYKILNSLEYNISGEYSPFDYGMIIGSGIEIPVLENFILMPGLRIRYGLPNIFAGQEDFPATLNTTRNASVEFRVSFLMPIRKL